MGAQATLVSSLTNALVLANMSKGFWSDLILLVIVIIIAGILIWVAWDLYKEMKK